MKKKKTSKTEDQSPGLEYKPSDQNAALWQQTQPKAHTPTDPNQLLKRLCDIHAPERHVVSVEAEQGNFSVGVEVCG